MAAALCIVLNGCGSSHPSVARTASASASPSPTGAAGAKRAAVAAYTGMWNAFVHAAVTSNANDPALATYASEEALKTITDALTKNHAAGEVTLGSVVNHPVALDTKPSTQPTEVDIRDCADDSRWLKHYASGGLVNGQPGGRHLVTAVVKNLGGWKVTSFTAQEVGTCST